MVMRTLPILALLAAPVAVAAQDGSRWSQTTIHERIVIRIPRVARRVDPHMAAPPPAIEWAERKAGKCVPIASLTGAAVSREGDIDLIVNDGRRMRAKLGDDCPALDFYSGFYLKQTPDGMLCADRDAIRSRSGATCPIDRFRTLVARR